MTKLRFKDQLAFSTCLFQEILALCRFFIFSTVIFQKLCADVQLAVGESLFDSKKIKKRFRVKEIFGG